MKVKIEHPNCDYLMVFFEGKQKDTKRNRQIAQNKITRIVKQLSKLKGKLTIKITE